LDFSKVQLRRALVRRDGGWDVEVSLVKVSDVGLGDSGGDIAVHNVLRVVESPWSILLEEHVVAHEETMNKVFGGGEGADVVAIGQVDLDSWVRLKKLETSCKVREEMSVTLLMASTVSVVWLGAAMVRSWGLLSICLVDMVTEKRRGARNKRKEGAGLL
jgi:hypothetical protein